MNSFYTLATVLGHGRTAAVCLRPHDPEPTDGVAHPPTTPIPRTHTYQLWNSGPRAINNLAIQALIATYAQNKGIVDESAAHAAITETTGE